MDVRSSLVDGIDGLLNGLQSVNKRMEDLESKVGQDNYGSAQDLAQDVENLRNYTGWVYQQLLAHDDFVRNERFFKGIEQRAYNVVIAKCLPEIWKLEQGIKLLKEKVDQGLKSYSGKKKLVFETEDVILRLASLGNERIEHIEIVGDSGKKRNKNGTPRRTLVSEKELKNGTKHPNLPVPKSWKTDSDTKTINKNFQEITRMINNVVLTKIDQVEENLEKKIGKLEKKVQVLHDLFFELNKEKNQTEKIIHKNINNNNNNNNNNNDDNNTKDTNSKIQNDEKPENEQKNTSSSSMPNQEDGVKMNTKSQTQTCTVDETNVVIVEESTPHFQKNKSVTVQNKDKSKNSSKILLNPKKSHQSGAKAARAAYNRSIKKTKS